MRANTALLITLAMAVAACGTQDDAGDIDTTPGAEIAPAPPAAESMDRSVATGQFEGTGDAGSEIQGTAELLRRGAGPDQGMELAVQLTGLSEGSHAWHIHQGTCENRGSVVLPLSDAPAEDGVAGDLEADGSGIVQRTVTLDAENLALLTGGEGYSLNVHSSGSDNPGPPVACATLDLPADLWGSAGTGAGASDTAPTGY